MGWAVVNEEIAKLRARNKKDVSEELGVDEPCRQDGCIPADEALLLARRNLVHHAGGDFFSRATLSEQERSTSPSEADALIVQATIGCSWNHCTYCDMSDRTVTPLAAGRFA